MHYTLSISPVVANRNLAVCFILENWKVPWYLLKFYLFFNWRIIALQNFVVSCQTSIWILSPSAPPTLPPGSQCALCCSEHLVVCVCVCVCVCVKAMAPHSSTLAWKIPWMEEPGGLQSMGSRRVRHDWVTSLSLFTFMHWRRKWQPTPMFLPGESQRWGSLVGCSLWGHTELDMTEVT